MIRKGDMRSRTRKRSGEVATLAKHKVVVNFPRTLLERTEEAASALAIDRSKLIRSAVERYLEMLRREKLEKELAAGYEANASLDRAVCEDFAHADAENI
jgi:metal-responsive CopG/Arc/MetJ family transcriptional regulator